MTKLIIVEDHESMREMLSMTFSKLEGFSVVACISDASLAEIYCRRLCPDLIILDVCTEGGTSGLAAAETVIHEFPHMKVIVMSGFDEITYAPRAKGIGAHAFIYKSRSLAYFAQTAEAVMRGETVFPEPKVIPMPGGEAPLTVREMEVLRLMCRHMTSKEIADELFISENTVKYHKANMLAKTGFSKAVELAFFMISNGWINPLY